MILTAQAALGFSLFLRLDRVITLGLLTYSQATLR